MFGPAIEAKFPPVPPARLIELGGQPSGMGWLQILRQAETLPATDNANTEQRQDYYALCLASHHATVASFIPTDVDAKIRGQLWIQRDVQEIRNMFEFTLKALNWDVSEISTRTTELSGRGPVSGHNGEMLGVLAGALGAFLRHGDAEFAARASEAIDNELAREAAEFRHVMTMRGHELDLLRLASSLTHNVGDLDQGLSFWSTRDIYQYHKERFQRLAHENTTPHGGTFQIAAKLYKKIMASEGHRHYPLRSVRALRQSADFLLPLGPFFDEWGARLGSHPSLTVDDRGELLGALLSGCKKIQNQVGYFRAISGMLNTLDGKLDHVVRRMPASLRQELKDPEIRRHVALKQISFESGMRKRALAALAER